MSAYRLARSDEGGRTLRPICLALLIVLFQPPSRAQDATAEGLKGPVNAVLTESFRYEDGVTNAINTSYVVYDRRGFQSEGFLYKPDGSLWVHTIITRDGDQILKSQTIGTAPFENHSEENVFDAQGRAIETDEYDGSGTPKKKTIWKFDNRGDSTTARWTQADGDGTEKTGEIIDTTDSEAGITRQVSTVDGESISVWFIQREGSSLLPKDKIVFPDGSYNEREQAADGSTVEDRYQASANSHTYQKTDAQGDVVEVIEKSDRKYIRCTYVFDEKRRPTGQINYDASGKIIDKSTTDYVDDSHGNWSEKRTLVWHTNGELPEQKIIETTVRTINYYQPSF